MTVSKASSVINAASDPTIRHIPKFGGEIWFVDGVNGLDTNDGLSPDQALLTIGAAITAASAGDAITVRAATYTEVGLDLDEDAVELWFEIGTIIDPVSGTALTVSGDYCRITGPHTITPAAAAIGLLISGTNCQVADGKVQTGGTGVRITGSGAVVRNYASGNQTSIAYDIQGGQARLYDCSTVGTGATIGYKISGGVDTGVLRNCTSVGHTSSSFYIDTGSSNWTIFGCSSGAGDGRWVDVDDVNVWNEFSYDEDVSHITTFAAGGPSTDNLFKVSGTILITKFSGHVDTVLAADVGACYIELYDGTNTVDVTDSPGPDFSSLPVDTFIHKIDDATVAIAIEDSSQVRLYEDATKFGEDPHFQVTAKAGADTYIRLVYAGTATSGVIHWHAKWAPLSDDGFVDSV